MRTGVVYMATVGGRDYIGQTINFAARKIDHLEARLNTYFHRVIRKYGADTVEWQILEEGIPEHDLLVREEFWIAFYDTHHNGLNMTPGGEVSPMKVPEIAARAGQTRRERYQDENYGNKNPERRKKMSDVQKAKYARGESPVQRPEVVDRIRKTQLEKGARGENPMQNPAIAKKVSDTLIALAKRGEHPMQNPEVAAKNAESQLALSARGENPMQNPETAAKQSATMKLVHSKKKLSRWTESGQEFLFDMSIDSSEEAL